MSRFEIVESASVDALPDEDGHFFSLLKDGEKVFGGCFSDCLDQAYFLGKDGEEALS